MNGEASPSAVEIRLRCGHKLEFEFGRPYQGEVVWCKIHERWTSTIDGRKPSQAELAERSEAVAWIKAERARTGMEP